MEEAGVKPSVSAYDKVIDSAEAMVKSAGANVPRETLEESIKNAGMNPNVRHGFGAYIGMNTLDTNPETVKKIHSSPLVSAMQEGYESTLAMGDADHLAYIKQKEAIKLKSFAENPDDLYAKYLDHVGRIKSEGGILNSGGGIVPDFYSNDPVEIAEKALKNLAEEEGLPFRAHELSQILNTNTNYVHQGLVNEYKNSRSAVSVTGETIDDLKANPKYSPSGSATIEEIETVLKKEQIQMMRSRASGLPTGSATVASAKPGLRVGTPASSTTVFDSRKSAASDITKATVSKAEPSAVRATVTSSAPIKTASEVASEVVSATAGRTTKTMLESVSDLARSVTKGHGGSTGLLVAGAATILGISGANRARSNNENKR